MNVVIDPPDYLQGSISPPGDKSISHRSAIIGALAEGTTVIEGFLEGNDCISTLNCLRALGVKVDGPSNEKVIVQGCGLFSLKEPEEVLDAGNSGTTMRLMLGLLAGQDFFSVLTGDKSLCRRPMGRVVLPLTSMGADIRGRQGGTLAPLSISGRCLKPITYTLPVASAQVKSALLLAALHTIGKTKIEDPYRTRDHTERMLKAAGATVKTGEGCTVIEGGKKLNPLQINVPGDISSAAFFLVAACIHARSLIYLKNVGLNPTRTGILDIIKIMGGQIVITNLKENNGEPVGDMEVSTGRLHGVEIYGKMIPRLIDEIPVLAVAAAVSEGITEIRDAAELKVKESNRIHAIVSELKKMGAVIEGRTDGLVIQGGRLRGATVESHGDHRLAMALSIAALVAEGETIIRGAECINISYPGFFQDLTRIGVKVRVQGEL